MKWMIDFNEAEAAGMALRIADSRRRRWRPGSTASSCSAWSRSLTVADTATQLADLLDAHHYTDGLAFLRPGTPTNNTDDRRAGYSTERSGTRAQLCHRSRRRRRRSTTTTPCASARRWGCPSIAIAAHVRPRRARASSATIADMRSMNTALWQVGWGYFLSNMIGAEAGLTPPDDRLGATPLPRSRAQLRTVSGAALRRAALRHPAGHLARSVAAWHQRAGGGAGHLAQGHAALAARQRLAPGGGIGRAHRQPAEPGRSRCRSRRRDADRRALERVSHAQCVRPSFPAASLPIHGFRACPTAIPAQTALLQQLGIAWRPRLTHLWNADWQWNLSSPLVQAGEVSPWAKLEPNYIATLLAHAEHRTADSSRGRRSRPTSTTSLLQMLLRHALLREIAYAAAQLQAKRNRRRRRRAAARRRARRSRHRRAADDALDAAARADADRDGRQDTIREYLEAQTTFTTPALAALGEFRASLTRSRRISTAKRSLHLMQGTLDLSAHRLDAWVTSFATKRLAAMHVDGPAGQYIGAYGWVENLKPMPAAIGEAGDHRCPPASPGRCRRRPTTAASFTRRR